MPHQSHRTIALDAALALVEQLARRLATERSRATGRAERADRQGWDDAANHQTGKAAGLRQSRDLVMVLAFQLEHGQPDDQVDDQPDQGVTGTSP